MTSITTRLDPLSFEELFSHLLTYEAHFTHQAASLNSPEITANVTTKPRGSSFPAVRSGRNRGSSHRRGCGCG